jgi:hypothetical protein
MITPAGSECPYYYQDFHRGRELQECRLIEQTPEGGIYSPDLCAKCQVPRIVQANACKNLHLEARASNGILGFRKGVQVSAFCIRSERDVKEPEIGCGECHLEFPAFQTSPEQE